MTMEGTGTVDIAYRLLEIAAILGGGIVILGRISKWMLVNDERRKSDINNIKEDMKEDRSTLKDVVKKLDDIKEQIGDMKMIKEQVNTLKEENKTLFKKIDNLTNILMNRK